LSTNTEQNRPAMTLSQAGAIPFRASVACCEFLLVTSHRGRWIFPKGIVEPGDTPESTAVKEAREEAGVVGKLLPEPLGSYGDRKWQAECEVTMFLLEYSEDCAWWEESRIRRRRWSSYEDALRLITKPELRAILERARERIQALTF
jgi:phosphohistidine phosphatase